MKLLLCVLNLKKDPTTLPEYKKKLMDENPLLAESLHVLTQLEEQLNTYASTTNEVALTLATTKTKELGMCLVFDIFVFNIA